MGVFRTILPWLVFAIGFGGGAATAAPSADLWPRWQAHDPAATTDVDHSDWGVFLTRYALESADGVVRVRYGTVDGPGRALLDGYLARMQAVEVGTLRRDVQMAFWINLYNALTVAVILDHYPTDSILDIDTSPGLFSNGPWGAEVAEVEGEVLTLDDIEHRILRPIWRDPRIHYAVNCASIGCPNLALEPYDPERLETQLDAAARDYVNHSRGARVVDGELRVSSLYEWYTEDFGDDEAGVIAHLRIYAKPDLLAALDGTDSIDGHDYDWALNDAR